MNTKSIAIAAIIGSLGGAALSSLLIKNQQHELEERLIKSPPIVVVDFAKMAMQYPEGASSIELEGLMMKTNEAVIKLREAGYLVIDAGAVVSAPDDVYLPEDFIK